MSALENAKTSKTFLRSKKISQFIENRLHYLESSDFQKWIQNKTPRLIHPLLKWTFGHSLNYALDWIRPELHRHGFRIAELTLTSLESTLSKTQKNEIPFYILLSGLEQSLRLFFNQHIAGQNYELELNSLQFERRHKWNNNLQIKLSFDEKKLDHDLYLLQKNGHHEFENQAQIKVTGKKNPDTFNFKVFIKMTPLVAYSNKKGSE